MAVSIAHVTESLNKAFRPHYPIEEREAFSGRSRELDQVEEGILSTGLHVLIYGERGAGKTSLANIATAPYERVRVFCEKGMSFSDLAKSIIVKLADTYSKRDTP